MCRADHIHTLNESLYINNVETESECELDEGGIFNESDSSCTLLIL